MTPSTTHRKRTTRPPRPLSVAVSSQPQPQPQAKRQHLTYHDKLRIIDFYHANSHHTQTAIARHLRTEYPTLSQSTLSTYLSREQQIREYVRLHPDHLGFKRPMHVMLPDVDSALSEWVFMRLGEGSKVTGEEICDRGREMCDEMGVPENRRICFSSGWLDSFKRRIGLGEVWIGGERALGLVNPRVV